MKDKIVILTLGLTILICLLTNEISFSQVPIDSNRNEIGLGTAYFPKVEYKTIIPNISYKYIFNKNVIRTGFSYNLFVKDLKRHSDFIGNIGYERRFLNSKFQLLFGVDFTYHRTYHDQSDHIDPAEKDFVSTWNRVGVGPVIGCIYKFNKKFSFQTELGMTYGYGKLIVTHAGTTTTEDNGDIFTLQRLFSLHLFYTFGGKHK